MGIEPAETTAPAAKDFAVIFNKVVEALEKAKLSMKVQVDRHWNPALDYKVDQQVWLSTDNLHMLNCASNRRLQYSPLHTPHCALRRPGSDRAETQVNWEEVLSKVLHVRHSQPGEFSESWGA